MIDIVLGAFFGDEGKGQTVHELCKQRGNDTMVVRFSGGHQVGHTVIHEGKTHVFSNFGSGSLLEIPTYWSEFCTVDPHACVKEKKVLSALGVDPRVVYHPLCKVVIPYDIICQIGDEKNRKDGTVGTGFGTCLRRCKAGYPLYAIECRNIDVLRAKVMSIYDNYYHPILEAQASSMVSKSALDDWIWEAFTYFKDVYIGFLDRIEPYRNYVFEGSQGILLDQNFGIMPYCTPSNVTSQNAWKLIPHGSVGDITVHYVCRPYITRHGNGPTITNNPTSKFINPEETNYYNEFQGGLRQVGMDFHLLAHSILMDTIFHGYAVRRTLVVRQQKLVTPELSTKFGRLIDDRVVDRILYRDLE